MDNSPLNGTGPYVQWSSNMAGTPSLHISGEAGSVSAIWPDSGGLTPGLAVNVDANQVTPRVLIAAAAGVVVSVITYIILPE